MSLNSLDWWKAALVGNAPAFDPNIPARGWYRARRKGEDYKPIAYWYNNDKLECMWGTEDVEEEKARKIWLWAHKNPISHEVYEKVMDGGSWPDIDPVVAAHNIVNSNQIELSPVEEFDKKVEEASASADKYNEVTSDEQAVQAQTLRAHLLKMHKDADGLREEEKKPYFEEAKAVDNKWQPSLKKAKGLADKIRQAISAWETKKLNAKKPPAPDNVSEKNSPTVIKGASGRAAVVKERRVVTAITNLDALMHSLKGRPELEPMLLGLAQKILDENGDVLGVSIEKRAVIS